MSAETKAGPKASRTARLLAAAAMAAAVLLARAQTSDEDPRQFIEFVDDFAASCVQREGVMIMIHSTHATRTIRVWLERWHMGANTGDRGKSELKPGAEPEKLGCSRTDSGKQEWKIVRAQFVD